MRRLSQIFLSLVVIFALAGCATFDVTENGIYRPIAGGMIDAAELAIAAPDYRMTEHRIIASDGAALNGIYLVQPGATQTVIFFGGNGFVLEKAARTAAIFYGFGVNLMMVDTRGYGNSAAGNDAPTIAALMSDGEAIFDYVKALPVAADQQVIVHGHSMGSFIAGHVAATRPVDAAILQSSATTTDEFAHSIIPGLMKPFVKVKISENLQGQGNLQNMAAITAPLLIIVGAKDKQTAAFMSEKLYAASPLPAERKTLAIIKGAGHGDIFNFPDGVIAYRAFLDRVK